MIKAVLKKCFSIQTYARIRGAYNSIGQAKTKKKSKKIYLANRKLYEAMNDDSRFVVEKKYERPCLEDRFEKAGSLGSYFWQDLWASKLIFSHKPKKHYDIGSRVDGFIAHLSSFGQETVLIDVRPMESTIPCVSFIQDDATMLRNIADSSVESISALCSLEHFGLGRYGDPVRPSAWHEAMQSIVRVLEPGGHAYISVPVGTQHLEFDAHRIFFPQTIIDEFKGCELVEFSTINPGVDSIEENVPVHKYDNDPGFGGHRFGLFHFVKSI